MTHCQYFSGFWHNKLEDTSAADGMILFRFSPHLQSCLVFVLQDESSALGYAFMPRRAKRVWHSKPMGIHSASNRGVLVSLLRPADCAQISELCTAVVLLSAPDQRSPKLQVHSCMDHQRSSFGYALKPLPPLPPLCLAAPSMPIANFEVATTGCAR